MRLPILSTRSGIAARTALALALAVAIVPLAGCASDTTSPLATTSFSATVSGSVQATLSGPAQVELLPATIIDSTTVPASALLGLVDHGGSSVVTFQWAGTSKIATGDYKVGTDTASVAMIYDTGAGTPASTFEGQSGTLTISSMVNGVARGTFSVSATSQDSSATVKLSGSFVAPVVTQLQQ